MQASGVEESVYVCVVWGRLGSYGEVMFVQTCGYNFQLSIPHSAWTLIQRQSPTTAYRLLQDRSPTGA